MRRRAAEEPELFVDAADPQPARRSPTRAEITITLRFLMTRTVLVTVPEHRVCAPVCAMTCLRRDRCGHGYETPDHGRCSGAPGCGVRSRVPHRCMAVHLDPRVWRPVFRSVGVPGQLSSGDFP